MPLISSHATINLEMFEGASLYQEFIWETGDPSVPVDLTGMTARMQVRDEIEDTVVIFDLNTENGGIILVSNPPDDGKYVIYISRENTEGLCPDHTKRFLVYDLFFYIGTEEAGLHQRGKISLYPSVTRPNEDP